MNVELKTMEIRTRELEKQLLVKKDKKEDKRENIEIKAAHKQKSENFESDMLMR